MKKTTKHLAALITISLMVGWGKSDAMAQRLFLQSSWQNTIGTTNSTSVAIWTGGNESAPSNAPSSSNGFLLIQSAVGQMTSSAPVPPVIRPGDVIVGLLSTNAPVVTTRYLTAPPGWAGYADDYLLQGLQPGATVILRLDSSDFDTFLEVRVLGEGVASDDNNGGGSNSRYPLVVGQTTDRDYIIRVTSSTNLGVGYYTLRVEQSLAPQILSFGPSSGVPGALVRVRGLNFLNASGISQITAVRFGSVQAIAGDAFTDGVEEAVDVLVPEGAVTGPITVETFNGTVTSTSNFVVLGRIGFLRRETGGGFSFGVTNGTSNLTSVVEATTSLSPPVIWQPVATNLILNPQVWRYTNQTLSPFSERFFRVTVK